MVAGKTTTKSQGYNPRGFRRGDRGPRSGGENHSDNPVVAYKPVSQSAEINSCFKIETKFSSTIFRHHFAAMHGPDLL
jgi:hypothetical protein